MHQARELGVLFLMETEIKLLVKRDCNSFLEQAYTGHDAVRGAVGAGFVVQWTTESAHTVYSHSARTVRRQMQ